MQPLNTSSIALSGINLVEASAGTGKTYALTELYLRLIIEKELLPESILVVTYTEAATKELRQKIRERIRDTTAMLASPLECTKRLASLGSLAMEKGAGEVSSLLENALYLLDTASVFTIHGFCLRALQDNAFESGSLYDTEIAADERELAGSIVDDFWRSRFFSSTAVLPGYAMKESPESFLRFLGEVRASSGERIIPQFSSSDIVAIEDECQSLYSQIAEMWRDEGEKVKKMISEDRGLSRAAGKYREDDLVELFRGMDAFVEEALPFSLFEGIVKFSASRMAEWTKKKFTPPRHKLFELCDCYHRAIRQRFLALKAELILYCRDRLPKRKKEANIRFFDDLLHDMHTALFNHEEGEAFRLLLRRRWPTALIDEFQDTDARQYDIFRSIYEKADGPLFLIGDPKQAIYSFRGADVFAYLKASRNVEEGRRFTLTHNWRSVPQLLDAFNVLFSNVPDPFLFGEISYRSLVSGTPEREDRFVVQKDDGRVPLEFLVLDASMKENALFSVDEATGFASEAVAGEIFKLLRSARNGETLIGGRPLRADDIAVIVRSHRQAARVRDALTLFAIPSVVRSDRSVFASNEAREIAILLAALVDPSDEGKIRAALITDILGRSGNDIGAMMDDESLWVPQLHFFARLHSLWIERGFMTMATVLLREEDVRRRLLSLAEGERRLTNLLHCIELLHQKEHEEGVGPEALASWFTQNMVEGGQRDEEYQLRLETDEPAVKIMTIHVSKGLQFPVVYCPFLWNGSPAARDVAAFHDEGDKAVLDFGSEDFEHHLVLSHEEQLAEDIRLLYVALTRAVYSCSVVVAPIRKTQTALNHLLQSGTRETLHEQLNHLIARGDGAVGMRTIELPCASVHSAALHEAFRRENGEAVRKVFTGRIDRSWRIASFSFFTRGSYAHPELPDRDEMQRNVPDGAKHPGPSIVTFPGGAQAGIFMHSIFETLDFSRPFDDSTEEGIKNALERSGYHQKWLPVISSMVRTVLSVSLGMEDGSSFTLSDLKPGEWVTEMEFFFPLRFLTPDHLSSLARTALHPAQLDFAPVRGMLIGYIDMVFQAGGRYWLLDWKSNHLGESLDSYTKERMEAVMGFHHYDLQYLLYTVALHRYLSVRIPDYRYQTHFGGVIYVFLRGVDESSGESRGFYRARPSEELVNSLTEILIETGG
ncbi:exodeoxyribonuclease V subunit beta [Chlorobium phaeovibrioides]|uniref:RecBCD enzyme subunit RecB n=1 Tax=Chlorobium phaeovibrioides TaxID=1094 RepID=A0ABW9UPW0_CHLPH|nr:exodeoxyribonuclease V subunit beta [Chlorobium phaeovibrioides]MWV54522.1 exodeoxyribonuclease V subunit beta [Chlorobium phaeovibrioides]